MLPVIWVSCGVVIVSCALRARRSRRASRVGQCAVAVLFLGAGALVNAVFLAGGEDYVDFADGAYVGFVADTWRDLVVPNHHLFISVLIVFETVVGVLMLAGGRFAQVGLVAAIAFHVGLLSFGWGFYLWSIPMIAAFTLLLSAGRQPPRAPATAITRHAHAG